MGTPVFKHGEVPVPDTCAVVVTYKLKHIYFYLLCRCSWYNKNVRALKK